MKRKNILTFLLLLSMSFSIVHAYAIDMLDTHECHVSEYVEEFSQPINDDISGDICNIHAAFHTSVIMPENIVISKKNSSYEKPQSFVKIYEYQSNENLLRPPRT
ncbi:MAG: hypothetical protein J7K14_05705 [Sulfurimonas sp.]|nr:hypothetical protein [Sulfurimonas sp.]